MYFYRGLFGGTAPQQPSTDHRRQGHILQALGVGTQLQWTLHQLGIDLQQVLHLFDAPGSAGHVLGQLPLDLVLHLTGKPRLLAVHFNLDTK
ncbi:hypothetical protein D9M71_643050 [compost metagenome]